METIGKIRLKLSGAAGINDLEQALTMAQASASKYLELELLLELGKAQRDLQQFDLALAALRQGLEVATAVDAKNEVSAFHLLLAELYEQMNDVARALAHFKQHQVFKEQVAGEKSRTAPASATSPTPHVRLRAHRHQAKASGSHCWRCNVLSAWG